MTYRPAIGFIPACTLVAVFAMANFAIAGAATAQVTDQRRANRRAFVEDLLRGLIESQVPQQLPPRQVTGRQPLPPGRQPIQRPVVEVSPDMLAVRNGLSQMAGQYDGLIRELQTMEFRSPRIRPLMADALQVRAAVDGLARKAELYPRVDALTADYQAIDRNYRVLTHRLRETGQMTDACQRVLQQIDTLDTQLCERFGIRPQIDRRELLRLTTTLRSDFQHTLQDLYYESNDQPELRPALQSGKVLLANLNQATGLISTADYEQIVAAYQGCHDQWRDFNRQLYRFPNQRIIRDVQQLKSTGAQIQDLLYLHSEVDREYLQFLAGAVSSNAAGMMNLVTMTHLLNCPDPVRMVNDAREFCALADGLKSNVAAGQPIEDLAWDFRLFDVQWSTMRDQLAALNDELINQRLSEINYTVATLGLNVGEGPAISADQMLQLTSQLDQLTYQLQRETDRRLGRGGYQAGFANQLRKRSEDLHDGIHVLQTSLAAGETVQQVSRQVRRVTRSWDKVTPQLAKMSERDQRDLAYLRSQIEPSMVKLKLVFSR